MVFYEITETKTNIFKVIGRSVMTKGSDIWTMKKQIIVKLMVTEIGLMLNIKS